MSLGPFFIFKCWLFTKDNELRTKKSNFLLKEGVTQCWVGILILTYQLSKGIWKFSKNIYQQGKSIYLSFFQRLR